MDLEEFWYSWHQCWDLSNSDSSWICYRWIRSLNFENNPQTISISQRSSKILSSIHTISNFWFLLPILSLQINKINNLFVTDFLNFLIHLINHLWVRINTFDKFSLEWTFYFVIVDRRWQLTNILIFYLFFVYTNKYLICCINHWFQTRVHFKHSSFHFFIFY